MQVRQGRFVRIVYERRFCAANSVNVGKYNPSSLHVVLENSGPELFNIYNRGRT